MTLPEAMLPLPARRKPAERDAVLAECRRLEEIRPDVQTLVSESRHMAVSGDPTRHPGFLRSMPRTLREVKRLLTSLGVLGAVYSAPELRKRAQVAADKAVRRWDLGLADEDLVEEWEEALDRCRWGCQGSYAIRIGSDERGPFDATAVVEVMKEAKGWIGDINYSHIRKQLLREAL